MAGAGPKPQDQYQPFDATGSTVPETESPAGRGPRLNVEATPQDFGAQIGQAVRGVGEQIQKTGDLAAQYQGMMNETYISKGEQDYLEKAGAENARFRSLQGLDAANDLPNHIANLNQIRSDVMESMPNMAASVGFQKLTNRPHSYSITDSSLYVGQQIKAADLEAAKSSAEVASQRAGDINIASDDGRFGEQVGTIKFNVARMMQNQGWGSVMGEDGKGGITFADTPQGNQAKDVYQAQLDAHLGVAEENRYKTLASQNVMGAYDKYQSDKANIPPETQVKLDAWFKPQVRQAATDQYFNGAASQLATDHKISITSGAGSNPNNIGNVKTAEGSANGTASFESPATPTDGVILAANNLRKNYQGLTLEEIGNKWAPPGENQTSDWLKNVSTASGIKTDQVPNLNDPTVLKNLVHGIGVAEKSSEDRAAFTDDVLNQGVQASLAGKQPTLGPQSQVPGAQLTSGYQTQADYAATHKMDIVNQAEQFARMHFPNDPSMVNTMRERASNWVTSMAQDQAANYRQDNQTVMRALGGDFTNKTPPQTVEQLRAIPGMADVLDRVAVQDSKFYETIDKKIAEYSSRNTTTNSPNGYDTLMRVLEPSQNANGDYNDNRIRDQSHLDGLLGKSDGTGINMKDYTDAKKSLEASEDWKTFLSTNMKNIENANGNVDGLGQQRALAWYNQMSAAHKSAEIKPGFDEKDLIEGLQGKPEQHQGFFASRMEQLENFVKNKISGTTQNPTSQVQSQPQAQPQQTATGPNGEKYVLQGNQWVKQ